MATNLNVTRRIEIRATASGFPETTGAVKSLAGAHDQLAQSSVGTTTVTEQSSRKMLSVANAVDRLENRLSATARAQALFSAAQQLASQAAGQSLAIQEQANRVLAMASERYRDVAAAANASAAAQKRSVEGVVAKQTIAPNREEDIAAVGKQIDDVRSKYVPLVNIQRQYKEDLDALRSPLAKVAMSERERLDAIQRTKDAFAQQVVNMNTARGSMDKYAGASGLARHELINMSRQIQDVGVTVAMGQSPMMILMQQGTQIADIFASSQGTVKGFFGQIAEGAARIFTPTRVAIGATLGLGAAAVAVTASFQSAQRDIERNLMGIAGASRATVGDINRIAASTRSVFGLSSGEAREAAMTFAATGKIMVENIAPLVTMSDQLSRALGIGAADASKRLADAFADPARGAVELNKEFGALDQRTLEYIRTLQAMGNTTRAQQVLMESLGPAIARQAEMISFAEKAWRGFLNLVKEGFVEIPAQALSQVFNINPGTIKQLNDAEADLRRLQEVFTRWPNNPAAVKQMEALVDRVAELRAKLNADDLRQYSQAMNVVAENARQTAAAFVPEIKAIEDAGLAFNNLFLISQRPDLATVLDKAGLTAQQFATALERAGGHYLTMLSPAERLTAQHNLQLQAITAQTAEERIALAGEERRVQLAGASLSAAERELEINRARTLASAQIAVAHQTAVAGLRDQLAVAQAIGGAERMAAQQRATYNQLIREGRTEEQASLEALLQKQVAQTQINSNAEGMLRAAEDQHAVITATTQQEKLRAQENARINELMLQGVEAGQAALIAAQERKNAEAQITAQIERQAAALRKATYEASQLSIEMQQNAQYMQGRNYFGTSDNWLNTPSSSGKMTFGFDTETPIRQAAEAKFGQGGAEIIPGTLQGGKSSRGYKIEVVGGGFTPNEQGLLYAADQILGKTNSLEAAIAEVRKYSGEGKATPGAVTGAVRELLSRLTDESPTRGTSLMEDEIDRLRSEPRSFARDDAIKSLTDALENLRESTEALNVTIGLDPLFTQGHGYIGIGYNPQGGRSPRIPIDPNTEPFVPSLAAPGGAGRPGITTLPVTGSITSPGMEFIDPRTGGRRLGFSITSPGMQFTDPRTGRPIMGMADGGMFMVGGFGGRDSQYVPLRLTPGELIEVTPPRELHHYGQEKRPTQVVNNVTHNNTFNFPPSRSYGDRRSQRHLTEGFGRATAMARQ